MSTLNFKVVLLGEGRVGKTSILLRYIKNTYTDGRASTIQASFLTKTLTISDYSNHRLNSQPQTLSTASVTSLSTTSTSPTSNTSNNTNNNNSNNNNSNNNSNNPSSNSSSTNPPVIDPTSHKQQAQVKLSIWDTAGQERFHSLGPIYYRDASGAILVYDITDASSFVRVQSWVKELRKMVGDADKLPLIIVGNKCDLESQRQVSEGDVMDYVNQVEALHLLVSAKMAINIDRVFLELTRRMMVQRRKQIGDEQAVNAFGGIVSKKRKLIILPPGEIPKTESHKSCC